MKRASPIVPLGLLVACSLALAGCPRTPQSLCQETLDALNGMADRCMLLRFDIVRPSDGMTGCGTVQRVTRPDELIDQCIPWAESVDCDDLPAELPAFCSFSHFQYVE